MIAIRRVDGEAEAHDLRRLQELCFPADAVMDTTEGEWWLAWDDDDEAVGFACLSYPPMWAGKAYIPRVGVAGRARGRGLQRRLHRAQIARARSVGSRAVVTYVLWDNPASANNLSRLGFKVYVPREPYAKLGAIYYRLKLEN